MQEVKEWVEAWICTSITITLIVILALLFAGCSGIALLHGLDSAQGLNNDQIKALKENNQDIYACVQIGGPPPAGNTVWIIVPKGTAVAFKFGDGCHLVQ